MTAGPHELPGHLTVDDSDFSALTNALGGSVVSYSGSSSSVTNSRFVDFTRWQSFTSGTDSFLYVYYDRVGADIQRGTTATTRSAGTPSSPGPGRLRDRGEPHRDGQHMVRLHTIRRTDCGRRPQHVRQHLQQLRRSRRGRIGGTVDVTDQVVDTTVTDQGPVL